VLTPDKLRSIAQRDTYPPSRIRKQYLKRIIPWLGKKEIIILKGIRRSGKTHLMYQLLRELKKEKKEVFYLNLDDFRLDDYLNTELLEQLMQLRTKEETYFFLDEIQRVPGFEKWLRTYYDREEKIKFIISGSNISLLTPRLATVLTKHHLRSLPPHLHRIQGIQQRTF